MWSWTDFLSDLQPFYKSPDGVTQLFHTSTANPLYQDVTVKQLKVGSIEEAENAMKEGWITKNNEHKSICKCIEVVREDREEGVFVYIVSPRMPNSLEDAIQSRRTFHRHVFFPEETLQKMLRQLVSVFSFLQTRNIAHCDIKPQNILLDAEGNVKVCDFGLARGNGEDGKERMIVGTYEFMSPELREALRMKRERVSHDMFKSDVFSLGVCLLYASLLEQPKRMELQDDMNVRIQEEVKKMNYSHPWKDIIMKMLCMDEKHRPDFLLLTTLIETHFMYADDEEMIHSSQEVDDPLELSVTCGISHIRVGERRKEKVPCMITLKAVEHLPYTECFWMTDTIAVIDTSYSMHGSTIDIVKITLRKLVNMLTDKDRLCLISFNNKATRHSPLTRCTEVGKCSLLKKIERLRANSTTNICDGFLLSLSVLRQRRYQNAATTILLFSDGKDNVNPSPLEICMKEYQSGFQHNVTINTFGFGKDVDFKLLETLADAGMGVFYHIADEASIQQAFALALGEMTTIVAREIKLHIQLNPVPVRCSIPIIYSKDHSSSFMLPDISASQQKDMIFLLEADCQPLDKSYRCSPVTVIVEYIDREGTAVEKQKEMSVKFTPWIGNTPANICRVFSNWYRVRGAMCLKEARSLANTQHFPEAYTCLDHCIELLEVSGYEDQPIVAAVIKDMKAMKLLVESDTSWKKNGDAIVASFSYSHLSQRASLLVRQYESSEQTRAICMMEKQ